MFLSIIYFVYNIIDLYLLICSQTKTTYIFQKIHYIHNITYISYKSYWIRSHTVRFHESFQLNSLYFSRKKVMNTLEENKKQNLLSRIKEKSPLLFIYPSNFYLDTHNFYFDPHKFYFDPCNPRNTCNLKDSPGFHEQNVYAD